MGQMDWILDVAELAHRGLHKEIGHNVCVGTSLHSLIIIVHVYRESYHTVPAAAEMLDGICHSDLAMVSGERRRYNLCCKNPKAETP